jgi:predicted enzyme related to lactoylglutathione lyase
MNAPAYNTVAWFQAGTTDAGQAKGFYGELSGWRYTPDPNSEGRYHLVSYPGGIRPAAGSSAPAAGSRTTRSSWWWSRTWLPSAPRPGGSAGRC